VNGIALPDKNKIRVLIIDDEYAVCTSIARLIDYLGYHVDFVHTPESLRAFLEKNHNIDIVLLDINLGLGLSGIDLLPVIREKSKYTQVIMFTSEDKLEVGVECMRRGAYDYMTKPFDERLFLNKAAGALERKKSLQLNDLYLGILFHDLKNPLQGIMTSMDFLRMSLTDTALTETQKKTFHTAEWAINQILQMINNIVAVSKFESGVLAVRHRPFVLQKEVEKTLAPFYPPASSSDKPPFSVHFFSDNDFTVVSDKDLFCRVLANILSNALRYAAGKSTVQVEFFREDDGRIRTSVTNTGSFVEEKVREAIFHKFSSVQPHDSNTGFRNYGLGLTFSKMAVEAMGGSIWISCEKDVPSTTFHYTVKNSCD
jgi:two-component system, sensor histidine kinase and response regulator